MSPVRQPARLPSMQVYHEREHATWPRLSSTTRGCSRPRRVQGAGGAGAPQATRPRMLGASVSPAWRPKRITCASARFFAEARAWATTWRRARHTSERGLPRVHGGLPRPGQAALRAARPPSGPRALLFIVAAARAGRVPHTWPTRTTRGSSLAWRARARQAAALARPQSQRRAAAAAHAPPARGVNTGGQHGARVAHPLSPAAGARLLRRRCSWTWQGWARDALGSLAGGYAHLPLRRGGWTGQRAWPPAPGTRLRALPARSVTRPSSRAAP